VRRWNSLKESKGRNWNLSQCLTKYHTMKTYWESGVIALRILSRGIRWSEWSASRPGRLSPGKEPPLPIW